MPLAWYFNAMRVSAHLFDRKGVLALAMAAGVSSFLGGSSFTQAKPVVKAGGPTPAPSASAQKRSFEDLLADAEPVADLGRLIDPLFDNCDKGDPLEARQCQGARTFLESEARSKIYVAVGDTAAINVSPYDAATKELDIDIQGCLACVHPIRLTDSKGAAVQRFITTKVPRAIKAGHAIGLDVRTAQLMFATPERETRWKKQEKKVVPRLRVQFIFKLGDTWSSGNFSGAGFTPLGHRVFDACSGEVFDTFPALAEGERGKVATPVLLQAGDSLRCPPPGEDFTAEEKAEKEALAKLPAKLSRDAIEHGMSEVQERVHDCSVEFEETGTVQVRLLIEGATGRVRDAQISPPFDKTPAGLCVRAAMRSATFSRFRSETQEVRVPVSLR